MAKTYLSGLHTPEARQAVAEALVALFARWSLRPEKQARLLGLGEEAPYRAGELLADEPRVLERAGELLAIDRALRRRYPEDEAARDAWVLRPNPALDGFSPMLVMLGEPEGLSQVRALAESGGGRLEP